MSYAWIDALAARATLSPELVAWARTQPDLETAWTSCANIGWLIELGVARAIDAASQRAVVIAAGGLLLYEPWLLRLRPVLRLVRLLALPAIYALAKAWGWTRRLLTTWALREYRFEHAERDMIRPALHLAHRVPPALQAGFVGRFRRDCAKIAAPPAVSGASS